MYAAIQIQQPNLNNISHTDRTRHMIHKIEIKVVGHHSNFVVIAIFCNFVCTKELSECWHSIAH